MRLECNFRLTHAEDRVLVDGPGPVSHGVCRECDLAFREKYHISIGVAAQPQKEPDHDRA